MQWPYLNEFRQANQEYKQQQKRDFDECHRVRDLPDIPDNTDVWITTNGNPVAGRTVQMAEIPRSYVVQTPSGQTRRNRSQLNVNPSTPTTEEASEHSRSPIMTRSRTGTSINPPPQRLTQKGRCGINCIDTKLYYH